MSTSMTVSSKLVPEERTKVPITERKYFVTFCFVVSLFMLWGISMTMADVLNKHFQKVLHISKSQSGLVQFSIFGAYAVMAIPVGFFMRRFGYKRGVLLGLALYSVGAFLFIPASNAASFSFFRVALFVLACGLATLETVAHPFISILGKQASSERRLNFAQGFNGLGGVFGSFMGGYFILRASTGHSDELFPVKLLYGVIGVVILLVAISFYFVKVPKLSDDGTEADRQHEPSTLTAEKLSATTANATAGSLSIPVEQKPIKKLFQNRHFVWAIAANFFCVAIQGGTWAYFINYGVEKMNFSGEKAAYFFGLSMILKMGGRFLGVWWMRYICPHTLLAIFAAGGIVSCIIVAQGWGWISFIALISLNFFFSIFVPTIYGLGLKDLGKHRQRAASFIVLGVSGGAVFPPLMGLVANHDVATAYYLPIICYIFIFIFAVRLSKLR